MMIYSEKKKIFMFYREENGHIHVPAVLTPGK
jgi:hypothetical protein